MAGRSLNTDTVRRTVAMLTAVIDGSSELLRHSDNLWDLGDDDPYDLFMAMSQVVQEAVVLAAEIDTVLDDDSQRVLRELFVTFSDAAIQAISIAAQLHEISLAELVQRVALRLLDPRPPL